MLATEEGRPTRVRFEVQGGLHTARVARWDGERRVFERIESGPVPSEPGPMGL